MIKKKKLSQLDRIEAKLNYIMIKMWGWDEFAQTIKELEDWEAK